MEKSLEILSKMVKELMASFEKAELEMPDLMEMIEGKEIGDAIQALSDFGAKNRC